MGQEFRARICKPFKDSQPCGRFDNPIWRTGPSGNIGWRNRFQDPLNVYKFGLCTFCCAIPPPDILRGRTEAVNQRSTLHLPLVRRSPLQCSFVNFSWTKSLLKNLPFLLLKSVYTLLCELNLATLYLGLLKNCLRGDRENVFVNIDIGHDSKVTKTETNI